MPLFDKLVAYYAMDEMVAGADLVDSHTGGYTVTHLTDGADSGNVSGALGRARTFNRLAAQRFERADTGASDPFRLANSTSGSFSVSAWVDGLTKFSTTNHTVVGKQTTGSTEYALRYDTTNDRMEFVVANTVPTAFEATDTSTIEFDSDRDWVFFVGVYDSSVPEVQLWRNGSQVDTTAVSGTLETGTAPFHVGGESGIGLYWDGNLDEIGIFDDALTSTEIVNLYNGGTPLPYPLDEPDVPPAGRQRFPNRRRPRFFFLDEFGRPDPNLSGDGGIAFIPGQAGRRTTGVQIR